MYSSFLSVIALLQNLIFDPNKIKLFLKTRLCLASFDRSRQSLKHLNRPSVVSSVKVRLTASDE